MLPLLKKRLSIVNGLKYEIHNALSFSLRFNAKVSPHRIAKRNDSVKNKLCECDNFLLIFV